MGEHGQSFEQAEPCLGERATTPSRARGREFQVLVFLAAFCCLMFELVIARLSDFHLDVRNSFIAIPITFLGLAAGSLHVHFRPRIIEHFSIRRSLVSLALVSFATLAGVLLVLSQFLPVYAADSTGITLGTGVLKMAVFIAGFIIPFYYFGRILTVSYHVNRARIGAIYAADFFGAALACLATPLVFHTLSLAGVFFVFTLAVSWLVVWFLRLNPGVTAALFAVGIGIAVAFARLIAGLDSDTDFAQFYPGKDVRVEEIAHGWNEFSRCSVLRFSLPNKPPYYRIIHDNALSTVNLKSPYVPGQTRLARTVGDGVETAFLLRQPVDDVLVMFAGCGDEMVRFHEFSGGAADITGVELNGLVKELALSTPELGPFNLKAFLTTLPNVRLKIQEGRSYLEQETRQFDVIFAGSKANTFAHITGGTRKYLDTVEAYGRYFDHLKPGGLLVLDHQALTPVLDSLKRVFAQRGLERWSESVVLFRSRTGFDLIVAPDGFTREQLDGLVRADSGGRIRYAPFVKTEGPDARRITSPVDPKARAITDDRPFDWNLDFKNYELVPTVKQLGDFVYYLSWARISTLIFMVSIAACFIAVASCSKSRRPPASMLVYLLITGFCYLLVEVAMMARLELFLQDPLISMATVLTVFLLASGLGSMLFERLRTRIRMGVLPFAVAAVVLLTLFALNGVTRHLLGLPMPVRLGIAVALIVPASTGLGMFYPYAVAALVHNGKENVVPITYGISTLASVIGATYAMTMMIAFGYNRLLWEAALGYVLLGAFILATGFHRRFRVSG